MRLLKCHNWRTLSPIMPIIFLLITSAYTIVICLVFKGFTLLLSIGYLVIYLLFVIVVAVQSAQQKDDIK